MTTDDLETRAEQWRQLLTAGGRWHGVTNIQAAVHLLAFTELVYHSRFAELVTIRKGVRLPFGASDPFDVADVNDWAALPDCEQADRAGATTHRLLMLAASWAKGTPVNLRDAVSTSLGHAHARRVAEATLIAVGADRFYTLTPTPALEQLNAERAAYDKTLALEGETR